MPIPEINDIFLTNYLQAVALSLSDLRRKGLIQQTTSLDFYIHELKPGDWVLVKSWKEDILTQAWDGPFQLLLTTETAI